MCAFAREPWTWRSALRAQQHSACSGRNESRCRESAIIRGCERLNASLRCGSTSACGVPALNLYRVSPQGRRRFAVSVACYCCFFLIHSLHAVLPQNLQQQQPQQKYSAGALDFPNQNNQRDQQGLSTLFSGASPLPLFEGAAAATVPVLPVAAGGEEAARGAAAKKKVLPAPAEATFHFHGAASGCPSRAGATGRHVVSNILDVKSEKQLLAEDSRVLWQQQRQGTRNDREEERIKQKEERQENGGPSGADTGPMMRLQQLRGEENSHKKKQPSTQALESSNAPIPKQEYFLEKFKFWRKDSEHGNGKEELEHSVKVEESVQDKQGSTVPHSSVKTAATAVPSAAHQPAAGPAGELPKSAAVVQNSLFLSGEARRWDYRVCAEGLIKAYREGGRTANCRETGASPGRVHARAEVAVFGIGAAQTEDVPDAAIVNADSTSSGVLPGAAYTVRRRLAAVSGPSAIFSAGSRANPPSHSNARGPGMHSELPLVMGQGTHAGEATETLDTREEGFQVDGLSADNTLADVSRSRRVQRRRRGQLRGSAFEPRWEGTEALPVTGVATAIGTAELLQSLPQSNEEVARQQPPSTNTRLPGLRKLGTKSSDLRGRGGLGSSTGGDRVFDDSDYGRATGGSGAVRSNLGGPQGNRFSRSLGGIDATRGGYSTTTLDSSMTSVASPQQAGLSVPYSAGPLEQIAHPDASWSSNEFAQEEVMPARDGVSSVTNGTRFREHAQRLSALNDVAEAAAAAKADSASGTRDGTMPGASSQLSTPVHSVIDLGVTSEGATDASAGKVGTFYQPGTPQWQQQLNEESRTEPLVSTAGLLERSHLPPPVQELNGAEGVGWPAEKPEEAVEDSVEVKQLLEHRHIDKPLRKRQRVAVVLEALFTMLSVWLLTRLTVTVMRTPTREMPVPLLLGKALAVMWLGRRILAKLRLVGSAIQVLVQDVFLRRRRQQLLAVADALRTLQEEEKRMQPYT